MKQNSLLPLGLERSHVAERPADPLTVEAFVTTQAEFRLKSDAGENVLRCRRHGGQAIFEASDAACTFILRLHECDPPLRVLAEGKPLPRIDSTGLTEAETGWAYEGRVVVAKARARQLRVE